MQAPEAAKPRLLPTLSEYGRRAVESTDRGISVAVGRPLVSIGVLAVLQWVAILAYALTVRHNGWLFYQGGDQIWLLTTGWLLGDGELAPTYTGYGWPLAIAPIMRFTGSSFVTAMPPIILFNVLVLGPLALWAIYGLGAQVAGRAFGLLSAAVWVVLPFAVIPLWRDDYHERYIEQFLPGALGLTGLADYQSMLLLLVGALLFMRALETRAPLDGIAAGLVIGFAVGVKPSNGLFVAAPVVAALLARNLRPLLPFGLALLPALLTLAVWKERGLGSLPAFALEETRLAAGAMIAVSAPNVDRYVDFDWANLHDNANHLREYFWSARLLEWAPIAGAVGVARRSLPMAGLLGTWFGAFLIVKGTTPLSTVSSGSFFRFVMPGFPAYFLLGVSILLLVPTLGAYIARRWPEQPARALDRRLVITLAAVLALLPLVVVAVVRPMGLPPKAVVIDEILTPVDKEIDVDVRGDGEARELTWTHPPAGSSDVFYRVYRTDLSDTDLECADDSGAKECSLEMVLLGTTRDPRWRDGSPPPGSRYRIAVAANSRNDPTAGDVATISEPVEGDA
ncbi:MAG TPA: hypothetical protein VEW11_02505 [Gaiellaceae bacterium]|nr:hypothetical protein [Gaiellaceae bacterium]